MLILMSHIIYLNITRNDLNEITQQQSNVKQMTGFNLK